MQMRGFRHRPCSKSSTKGMPEHLKVLSKGGNQKLSMGDFNGRAIDSTEWNTAHGDPFPV